jgi:hypothetical protein
MAQSRESPNMTETSPPNLKAAPLTTPSREDSEAMFHMANENRNLFLSLLPKKALVAEIGVAGGGFAKKILHLTAPEHLHLIDPWEWGTQWHGCVTEETRRDSEGLYQKITTDFANSPVTVHRKTSKQAAGTFTDATFDWVYIDGDHRFAGIKEDLDLWWPKVKEGGYLAGHDFQLLSPHKKLQENEIHGNGVPRAVHNFITKKYSPAQFGLTIQNILVVGNNWAIKKTHTSPRYFSNKNC